MFYFRTRRKWLDHLVLKYDPVTMVPRDEWGARRPTREDRLWTPIRHILLYVDTGTESCTTRKQCIRILRALQYNTMKDFKYTDIKFNFLIGGDGCVYEGRGWKTMPERPLFHLREYHGRSMAIAFIGHHVEDDAPQLMNDTLRNLVRYGVDLEHVHHSCQIVPVTDDV